MSKPVTAHEARELTKAAAGKELPNADQLTAELQKIVPVHTTYIDRSIRTCCYMQASPDPPPLRVRYVADNKPSGVDRALLELLGKHYRELGYQSMIIWEGLKPVLEISWEES